MGAILCSAIIDKAELQLKETANTDHSAADLFGWLKSGQRQATILKPDVSVTNTGSGALTAGVKQSIPTGGVQILNVTHNLGTNGTTLGDAISIITLDEIAAINLSWTTDTASATVKYVMFDERDPKNYYNYPPQPSSSQGHVNIVYSVTPADPAATSNAITLDDVLEPTLLDYILYRAYSKDSAQSQFAFNRAITHWNLFVQSLGRMDLKEKLDHPRLNREQNQNR